MFDVDPDTSSSFKFVKKRLEKILLFVLPSKKKQCKETLEVKNDPTGQNKALNLWLIYINFPYEFVWCYSPAQAFTLLHFKCLVLM